MTRSYLTEVVRSQSAASLTILVLYGSGRSAVGDVPRATQEVREVCDAAALELKFRDGADVVASEVLACDPQTLRAFLREAPDHVSRILAAVETSEMDAGGCCCL